MSTQQRPGAEPPFVNEVRQILRGFADEIIQTRQRVGAMEARMLLADQGKKPRFPIEFRSQFGEELWIWDVLGRPTEGFFIEAGAFDGYYYSVTYGLEAMGWNGLLVEALPDKAELCRQRRPHSRVVNAALGRRGVSGTTRFVSVEDQFGGMLSYADAKTEHARTITESKVKTTTIEAKLTSLDELLKDHQGPIDAAVIDVEGAEIDVLDGFDLHKHRPRVLLLEENTGGRDTRLMQYMQTKPYRYAGQLLVNQLWVRADEEKMLERLRRF